MRLAPEQRLARKRVLCAVAQLVRELYEQEQARPLPGRLKQLLTQLDDAASPFSDPPSGADAV